MAKVILKVTINDPYFQYQLRVSPDACLVQIWWFQLKSVISYPVNKVKFMDWQTDGQTDRCRQLQYPFSLKCHGVKTQIFCHAFEKVLQTVLQWLSRDHFVNASSQWEMTLHCNVISHWLGAYTKWSLVIYHASFWLRPLLWRLMTLIPQVNP